MSRPHYTKRGASCACGGICLTSSPTLASAMQYAACACTLQHRTHGFTLLLCLHAVSVNMNSDDYVSCAGIVTAQLLEEDGLYEGGNAYSGLMGHYWKWKIKATYQWFKESLTESDMLHKYMKINFLTFTMLFHTIFFGSYYYLDNQSKNICIL